MTSAGTASPSTSGPTTRWTTFGRRTPSPSAWTTKVTGGLPSSGRITASAARSATAGAWIRPQGKAAVRPITSHCATKQDERVDRLTISTMKSRCSSILLHLPTPAFSGSMKMGKHLQIRSATVRMVIPLSELSLRYGSSTSTIPALWTREKLCALRFADGWKKQIGTSRSTRMVMALPEARLRMLLATSRESSRQLRRTQRPHEPC